MISRLEEEGWQQARKCGEEQAAWGEGTERENKAESIMYLNQSISWCSCLLLWSLRMKTWCSSHCWGTQWTSITVPWECCWGTSHYTSLSLFPSLDLPYASSSPDGGCGSRDLSEMMLMQMLAKAPAHALLSPSTHTQWLQRWSRRQWETGPELLTPQGPSVLTVLSNFTFRTEYDGSGGMLCCCCHCSHPISVVWMTMCLFVQHFSKKKLLQYKYTYQYISTNVRLPCFL